jgi:hypothetical protein
VLYIYLVIYYLQLFIFIHLFSTRVAPLSGGLGNSFWVEAIDRDTEIAPHQVKQDKSRRTEPVDVVVPSSQVYHAMSADSTEWAASRHSYLTWVRELAG